MDKCSFPGCTKPTFVKQTSHGPLCNGHYAQHRRKKKLTPLRKYNPRSSDSVHDMCPVKDCGRPSWHKHGYCQSHQRQIYAGEDLKTIRDYEFQSESRCQYDNCDAPAKSRGYCAKHYRSDWGVCKEPTCNKRMHNKKTGLCATHYAKYRKKVKNV